MPRLAWEAYVIYLIRGGVEERLWGIPWEIPLGEICEARRGDEARRGGVCFGRSLNLGSRATLRHATPWRVPCHPSHPEGHRRSMKSASRKGHKRKFRSILFFTTLDNFIFANSLFLALPNTVPCRRVLPDWDWHTRRDAFIYQPLIGLPICSLPASPLFFHGRYISLLSTPFPSPPQPNEPPDSALRSPHTHRVLSFMAAFPHNHSSLVFQTPPSHHNSPSHHLFAAPVSLQRHGLFVSVHPSSLFVTQTLI